MRSFATRGNLLLLAALALPATAAITYPSTAYAQSNPFGNSGMMSMVPASRIVADGRTEVTLNIVALNADGTAMGGLKGKLSSTAGSTGSIVDKGNGVYAFTYTPPLLATATDVSFTFKGKNASKLPMVGTWTFPAMAAPPAAVSISANPAQLILQQDTQASLSIKLTQADGTPVADGAKLLVRAGTGSVDTVTYLGNGAFTARYAPAEVNYPHLDLITVADARNPEKVYGVFPIKLAGQTNFPVTAAPGATVIVRIGDREYGPASTDAAGRASVPVIVPPGQAQATLVSVVNGQTTESPLDLKVPVTKRLSMIPSAQTLAGDTAGAVKVRVSVATPLGSPAPAAKVSMKTSIGSLSAVTNEGNGIYSAVLTPPNMATASTGTVTATLDGEPGVQSDSIELNFAPARPHSLAMTVEPSTLPAGVNSFKAIAKVTDSDGKGMSGQTLVFSASGAQQAGDPRDLKGGDYQAQFNTTGTDSVQLNAMVTGPLSNNPVAGIILVPASNRAPNDSASTTMITVLTVDAYGYPVANVPVELALRVGDGNLTKTTTTGANGASTVFYKSGPTPLMITMQARSGEVFGSAALLQAPAGAAPGFKLPVSGSASIQAEAGRWNRVVHSQVVAREGAATVAQMDPTTVNTGVAGPMAAMTVEARPATVAPGGGVTVVVTAMDAKGQATAGQKIQVLAAGATVGAVKDNGNGTYEAAIRVPADANAPIMVIASSADGKVTQGMQLAVSAPTWGPVATTTPDPVATTTTTTTTTPTPDPATLAPTTTTTTNNTATVPPPSSGEQAEFPHLRARVGFVAGSYSYAQVTSDTSSILWNDDVYLGGDQGTDPARAAGFDVDVAGWLPQFEYVGAEVQTRFASYGVIWPGTSSEIPDTIPHVTVNAMARYPFKLDNAQFHVGAKAGYIYGDFITYQKGETESALNYDSLSLNGFGVGGEIAAEFGIAHIKADILQGFFGSPYSTSISFDAGIRPVTRVPVFLGASFELTNRNIEIESSTTGAIVGELSDTQTLFVVGPGIEF